MSNQVMNTLEAQRLAQLASFREMLSDDYLFNQEHKQTKFIYNKFFDNRSTTTRDQRLELLNIASGLPALICEVFANYVGSPESPIAVDIYQSTYDFVWGGYTVFKLRKVDNKPVIELVTPDGYVKNDDGSEILYTYLTVYNETAKATQRYIFKQTYVPGTIVNQLYKVGIFHSDINTQYSLEQLCLNASEVSLTEIDATAEIQPVELTGLTVNPIVDVQSHFANDRKYGESDIRKVRSLISSIEVQLVSLQDQFLKHLEARFKVPVSKLPMDDKGLVDMAKLQVIGMEAGDPDPGYIVNTNPQIDKAFDYIDMLIRRISADVSIPVEFFGLKESGSVEAEGSKSKRMSAFIKKVERIRHLLKEGIEEIIEIYKQWGVSIEEDHLFFGPVFPVDKAAEANELKVAREAKLLSSKRAIMRYNQLSEQEAEEEFNRMKEEEVFTINNINNNDPVANGELQ